MQVPGRGVVGVRPHPSRRRGCRQCTPIQNPQVVSKDIVHDVLERRWCITEAKGHNNPLEGANLCVFLDIFVLNSDLVEPTNKVNL